jgi:hypothetical protein
VKARIWHLQAVFRGGRHELATEELVEEKQRLKTELVQIQSMLGLIDTAF